MNAAKCNEDEDQRMLLIKEEHVKERWKNYFDKFLIVTIRKINLGELSNPSGDRNCRFIRRIRMIEVKGDLRRITLGKGVGLSDIPIEVWKFLGDVGTCWGVRI